MRTQEQGKGCRGSRNQRSQKPAAPELTLPRKSGTRKAKWSKKEICTAREGRAKLGLEGGVRWVFL